MSRRECARLMNPFPKQILDVSQGSTCAIRLLGRFSAVVEVADVVTVLANGSIVPETNRLLVRENLGWDTAQDRDTEARSGPWLVRSSFSRPGVGVTSKAAESPVGGRSVPRAWQMVRQAPSRVERTVLVGKNRAPSASRELPRAGRWSVGAACTLCGNCDIDAGEECDDGNLVGCDGCTARCQKEVVVP